MPKDDETEYRPLRRGEVFQLDDEYLNPNQGRRVWLLMPLGWVGQPVVTAPWPTRRKVAPETTIDDHWEEIEQQDKIEMLDE